MNFLRRRKDSRVELSRQIAGRVAWLIVVSLVLLWLMQFAVSGVASLREIDKSQSSLAHNFSGRALDRIRQIESRLADTIATLELASSNSESLVELRRTLRLERMLVALTYVSADPLRQVVRVHRDLRDKSVVVPTAQSYPFVFGRLSVGNVEFKHELGPQIPFLFTETGRGSRGRIVGLLSLNAFSELISEFSAESSSQIFLALPDGTVVAHRNVALAIKAVKLSESSRIGGLASTLANVVLRQSWISKSSSGEWRLVASAPIAKSGWVVFFSRPLAGVLAGVFNLQLIALLLLMLASLSAVITSTFVGNAVTKPIVDLRNAVGRTQDDVEFVQPASIRDDEIGELSIAFARMVADISQSRRSLEVRVEEKTRDLAAANQELEIASRHKDEFLAHMSHELRTPLNAVIGFSDLLKAEYFGPLNQKQSEYVRDINASGQHLLSLINDILDLAKVEAGRMDLMLSSAHVAALVESCVALVSERVSRSRQTLTTDVAPDVSMWPLDERKVKQCLLNLLTNASKFTPGGGVIALRVWVDNSELVAAVSDNGVGIAADDLSRLFSEFYQAKAAEDASGVAAQREGTGLGLALTKGFVELHGGTIAVDSVVGKGSTFTIRFPALAVGDMEKPTIALAGNVGAAS